MTIEKQSLLEAPALPAHLIDSCNSRVWAIAWETAIKEALRQAVQDADISKMETTDHIPDTGKMVYTPLTKEEIFKLSDSWLENNKPSKIGWATTLERAVIERLGLRWPE